MDPVQATLPLPATAADLPEGLVLIDGLCVLCSASFRFAASRDPGRRFLFAPMQGRYGRHAAALLGLDPDDPESFAVIVDGRARLKSGGALHVLRHLEGWRGAGLLLLVPRPLRDWVYDRVARSRYRVFGRRDTCLRPTPGLARHMVPE